MARRQAIVLTAQSSRRGREAHERIPQLLLERGIDVAETYLETSHKDVCKRAKKLVRRKAELLVVCGGDGTQTSVVNYLAHSDTVLGVIPAGTGNSFAYGLGLTDDFEGAADAIAYGTTTTVDLGTVGKRFFANFITIGLAAEISAETPHGLKRVLGPVAYGIAGIVPMARSRPFRARFRWGKQRVDLMTHQIIIANGRFYGHTPIAPDATLNDGELTVFVREGQSRITPLETYLAFLRGDQDKLRGVHRWSTPKTISIKTNPKQPVSADGDDSGKTPVSIGIAPKALRVMVPLATTTLS